MKLLNIFKFSIWIINESEVKLITIFRCSKSYLLTFRLRQGQQIKQSWIQ